MRCNNNKTDTLRDGDVDGGDNAANSSFFAPKKISIIFSIISGLHRKNVYKTSATVAATTVSASNTGRNNLQAKYFLSARNALEHIIQELCTHVAMDARAYTH